MVNILLVEDNPGDVELIQESLTMNNPSVRVHTAMDGEEALTFLKREREHARAPQPDLVILDLNIPKHDGREVLRVSRRDARLRCIPVVVLTSSDFPEDIVQAYELGANCYVRKPLGLAQFQHVVSALERFWCDIVSLLPAPG